MKYLRTIKFIGSLTDSVFTDEQGSLNLGQELDIDHITEIQYTDAQGVQIHNPKLIGEIEAAYRKEYHDQLGS